MGRKIGLGGMVVLAMILSGCGAIQEASPTPDLVTDYVPIVSITGEVVPARWVTVSAEAGGTVTQVLVEPGDEVAEGEMLIQLDPTDAEVAVERADAALEAAQARLALLLADARPQEVAAAEARVEAAQAALSQAAARRDQLTSGATEAEIAAAQAQVTAAQAEQLAARETHEQTMKCYGFTRPDGTQDSICPLLGPIEEQARYRLQTANEELDAAQAQLDALVGGADERVRAAQAAVGAASSQRDVAEAQLALLQAGATPEEVAAQEAAVAQAEAALETARVALARTSVHAPLAGTVGLVEVRTGELVAPDQALVTLGDLSTLRVETTDLDEIDVARVAVGQQAAVTFDALPERVFSGRVTHIDPMAQSGSGGVNYRAIVELDEVDPAVRWGMTAFVDIEVTPSSPPEAGGSPEGEQ